MRRIIKISTYGVLLLLLGGGIGFLLRVPLQEGGGGHFQESPDKRWVAFASTLDESPVFGPRQTYYEFMIQTPQPSPRTVRKMRIDDTADHAIDWREEGTIVWTTNSSAVTFTCDASQTSLKLTLKIEP